MRFRRTTSPDDHGILIDNTDIRVLEHVEVLDRERSEDAYKKQLQAQIPFAQKSYLRDSTSALSENLQQKSVLAHWIQQESLSFPAHTMVARAAKLLDLCWLEIHLLQRLFLHLQDRNMSGETVRLIQKV